MEEASESALLLMPHQVDDENRGVVSVQDLRLISQALLVGEA